MNLVEKEQLLSHKFIGVSSFKLPSGFKQHLKMADNDSKERKASADGSAHLEYAKEEIIAQGGIDDVIPPSLSA